VVAQDKRMISVLRALVTYLKVKEKKPEKDEEDQVRESPTPVQQALHHRCTGAAWLV